MKRYALGFAFTIGAVIVFLVAYFGNYPWWAKDTAYIVAIAMQVFALLQYFNATMDKLAIKMPNFSLPLPESMEDDINDITHFRPTGTQLAILLAAGSIWLTYHFISAYGKWDASWGNWNVILVSLAVAAAAVVIILSTSWFHDQDYYSPIWVFLIPIGGICLCLWLGIYMTEPMELGGPTAYQTATGNNTAQSQEEDFHRSRAFLYFYSSPSTSASSSSSTSFSAPKCSGKSCNGYLIVLLVILVLILVIGSALIQHFWVLSCILLATIMVMIAVHELRVVEYDPWGYARSR